MRGPDPARDGGIGTRIASWANAGGPRVSPQRRRSVSTRSSGGPVRSARIQPSAGRAPRRRVRGARGVQLRRPGQRTREAARRVDRSVLRVDPVGVPRRGRRRGIGHGQARTRPRVDALAVVARGGRLSVQSRYCPVVRFRRRHEAIRFEIRQQLLEPLAAVLTVGSVIDPDPPPEVVDRGLAVLP